MRSASFETALVLNSIQTSSTSSAPSRCAGRPHTPMRAHSYPTNDQRARGGARPTGTPPHRPTSCRQRSAGSRSRPWRRRATASAASARSKPGLIAGDAPNPGRSRARSRRSVRIRRITSRQMLRPAPTSCSRTRGRPRPLTSKAIVSVGGERTSPSVNTAGPFGDHALTVSDTVVRFSVGRKSR